MSSASRIGLRLTAVAALAVFAFACADGPTQAPEVEGPAFAKSGGEASGDTYVFTAGKWGKKQTKAIEDAGGTVVWSHGRAGIGVAASDDADFLDNAIASGAFAHGAMDMVVEWQQPLHVAELDQATVTPGDEGFFPLQWNMQAIDAPGAWAVGADGTGARVAVIDGGLYDIHPDIEGNLDRSCAVSFVPGQPFNYDTGTFWHSTHVAGIIVGADNGFGVIGVAPGATLMHIKALHSGSGSFGAVIGGILFASDPASFGFESCQRAHIINMSLSALFPKSAVGGGQLLAAVTKAVNFAASRGVLVISAAANDGLDLGQLYDYTVVPAEAGSGLAISATGPVDVANSGANYRRFASYSNYGESLVSLAGPGGDFTLYPVGAWFLDMVLSTCRGTSTPPTFSFCFAAGTSQATPAVAGVAALIVGQNPGISLGKLKAQLKNSADDEGKKAHDEFYGHGFVNALNAVQ